jgi:hypothetical protein
MLTDEVSAQSILNQDTIFAIFTSLQSEHQPTVRAALEASLNLTLLNEDKLKSIMLFVEVGGLPWLMHSLQQSFKHQDATAVLYALKALHMLMKWQDPVVKVIM